ncbi:hypothetical protein [Chitinophaga sp. CF118]|uniref:hypothetical protein n=1 Tax=Chitinophaga sp. CF118 TaxID=1884367 RepID=UPI000B7FE30C|nr:hypothetical protein [Chitinophaga sp. CF118]
MRKLFLLIAVVFGLQGVTNGQFYYQDIFNTIRTENNLQVLKENKVLTQWVESLDANMESDDDFRCQREILQNYRKMKSKVQSRATGYSSMMSYFSTNGKLTKTVDSSQNSTTIINYIRDTAYKLTEVYLVSQDQKSKYQFTETRRYIYDSLGRPLKMIHFHNDRIQDSSTVTFTLNEKGQVAEEFESGNNVYSQRIYYKYNDKGLLTDIVRYSPSRQKMLPDYMFEYDNLKRITQMTTVNGQSANYTIWKYTYNIQGLPDKEECYGKKNELLGIIKYRYSK